MASMDSCSSRSLVASRWNISHASLKYFAASVRAWLRCWCSIFCSLMLNQFDKMEGTASVFGKVNAQGRHKVCHVFNRKWELRSSGTVLVSRMATIVAFLNTRSKKVLQISFCGTVWNCFCRALHVLRESKKLVNACKLSCFLVASPLELKIVDSGLYIRVFRTESQYFYTQRHRLGLGTQCTMCS